MSVAALLVAALFVAALACLCRADIIVLRNGNRLEGEIVSEGDDSVSIRIRNAVMNISRGNIGEIIRQESPRQLYQRMLDELDDDHPEGYYQVALYCQMEKLDDEAIELLRHALLLKPDYAEAREALTGIVDPPAELLLRDAQRRERAGNIKDAQTRYSRIGQLYPESSHSPAAAAALAQIYHSQQKYTASMEQWKRVIEIDPANTPAYLGVVKICELMGEFDKAVEILRNVLVYEKDTELRTEAERQLRLVSGIADTRAKLAEEPGSFELRETLAALFEELGHHETALRWMEQAVRHGSQNAEIVEKLARHFEEQHRPVKALQFWKQLLQVQPDGELAAEARQRIAHLEILVLVPEYMLCNDAGRRGEIIDILGKSGIPFDTVRAVVRQWLEYPEPESRGLLTHQVMIDGQPQSYAVYVPENYHPDSRWPLIAALHPAGGSGDNYVYTWIQHAQKHGYLVFAPTSARGEWMDSGGRAVIAALEDVCSRYNIDRNRIIIDGTSLGAYGAWSVAVTHPHMFAALISRSGAVEPLAMTRLDNLFQTSTYIMHGLQDKIVPVEAIRRVYQALQRMEYDVEYKLDVQAGHSGFARETERVMAWLASRERRPYPRQVKFMLFDYAQPRSHWLQAELFDDGVFHPNAEIAVPRIGDEPLSGEMLHNYYMSTARQGMATLKGSIDGNTIRVETRHLMSYTVLLDDEMVNLDEPVVIHTNGRQGFSGKVERSLPFMLEWARRHRDPEMIFSAYARIVVKRD